MNFNTLVSEATGMNSDLEHAVRGLLAFAGENATEADKQQFVEWIGDGTMFDKMHTAGTKPADFFECAEGKTWEEMEQVFQSL